MHNRKTTQLHLQMLEDDDWLPIKPFLLQAKYYHPPLPPSHYSYDMFSDSYRAECLLNNS